MPVAKQIVFWGRDGWGGVNEVIELMQNLTSTNINGSPRSSSFSDAWFNISVTMSGLSVEHAPSKASRCALLSFFIR